MKDQQEAEKKKVASQEIQDQLAIQTKDIKEKKAFVLEDLAKVEPAVLDAQQCECSWVGWVGLWVGLWVGDGVQKLLCLYLPISVGKTKIGGNVCL